MVAGFYQLITIQKVQAHPYCIGSTNGLSIILRICHVGNPSIPVAGR